MLTREASTAGSRNSLKAACLLNGMGMILAGMPIILIGRSKRCQEKRAYHQACPDRSVAPRLLNDRQPRTGGVQPSERGIVREEQTLGSTRLRLDDPFF